MAAEVDVFAKVAGLAGIGLGVYLLLARSIVRKEIFQRLTRSQSFNLLVLALLASMMLALAGIGGWLLHDAL